MNSRKAVSKSTTSSSKEKSYEGYSYEEENIAYVNHQMRDLEVESKQDGEAQTSHNSWVNVTKNEESVGGGNFKPQQAESSWSSWETVSKDDSSALHDPEFNELSQDVDGDDDDDDDDELLDDSEDYFSDGFHSDDSQKSHDTRKKSKWLRPFFESLDNLSLEQINEPARRWHCTACYGGPGAIDWYIGLKPLMAHAKTKGRIRMRLHRELAELLEEELLRRGTSVVPASEAFGKWNGLCETTADQEIVWPPMVVVMNTLLEKDENDKWKGMGNQELLEYFNTYDALKARHSYGPNGHRGMSVLIFEAYVMGYLEAERLHKQFRREGRDRDAWERHPALFYPGGKRQLYGFLATKEDLNVFNQHSHGKACLKFDMRSYKEMVVGPMKQMSEDNQKLIWLKNKIAKEEQRSKALEETFGKVSEKLRDMVEEHRIVRLRTKMQHEENKEEMDHQEKFVKDQLDKIHQITEDKKRAKVNQSDVNPGTIVGYRQRKEEIQTLMASELESVEEFEAERAKLIQAHEEMKIELKQKHLTEEIELYKKFDIELTKLTQKYAPDPPTFQISNT